MNAAMAPVDTNVSNRDLLRQLRIGSRENADGLMPESVAWHVFIELRKRGEERAHTLFLRALRTLLSRRAMAGSELPSVDLCTDEHRLAEDLYLADLWKAYKKCIRTNRTGPASLLLRDIEAQILPT